MLESLFPNGSVHYLAGGVLLGVGVSLLYLTTGLVGGMSSVFSTTLSWVSKARFFHQPPMLGSRVWRLVYAAGVLVGAAMFTAAVPSSAFATGLPWWQLLAGGFLVGFGARLSRGCTSGHGICGMASLQLPSILAVLTFLVTGMITANLVVRIGAGA
ncbi:MAG: YeeE/YedE family protein [Burkholderiales bacterium]|nr:YeeE/YedE family protein [Burkholderiales bacterium]